MSCGKYSASTIEDSVITCNKIINAAYTVLTNMPTIVMSNASTNVTSDVSTNFRNTKVRYKMDYYVLHTDLFMVILLFIIQQ